MKYWKEALYYIIRNAELKDSKVSLIELIDFVMSEVTEKQLRDYRGKFMPVNQYSHKLKKLEELFV